MVDERIGFDVIRVLIRCKDVSELDRAMKMANDSYPVLREQLEVRNGLCLGCPRYGGVLFKDE